MDMTLRMIVAALWVFCTLILGLLVVLPWRRSRHPPIYDADITRDIVILESSRRLMDEEVVHLRLAWEDFVASGGRAVVLDKDITIAGFIRQPKEK